MKKLLKAILGPLFSTRSPLYHLYHKARGITAAMVYGFPTARMVTIGVTGTNGKTATCNMLAHILEAAGNKVGLMTTVNFWVGQTKWVNETKMTTDSPFKTQKLLRRMANHGCRYAIVETSSHALAQHRTWGILYDVAVFTNLTQDHLDYHRTMTEYRLAKERLFKNLYASWRKPGMPKIIVLNFDDPLHSHFSQYAADQTIFYTTSAPLTPDSLRAVDISTDITGSRFTIEAPTSSIQINLRIAGRFNIENAMAAASTAYAMGLSLQQIKAGLESIFSIPGRMETINAGQPFRVIVDYAHTPDGYDKALSALREITPGRLIVVFGSAGDRDKTKRPLLGEITSRYGDILILTEEDPGSEDPAKIIAEVRAGIANNFQEAENLFVIVDRQTAVAKALSLAQPQDTVAFLALGAQTVMARRGKLEAYDERQLIKNLLQSTVK